MKTRIAATLVVVASLAAVASQAQTAPPMPRHTTRPGILGRMFGHHGATPGARPGSFAPIGGGIVGNKNTHVYHMPGDRNLPEPKNRVYFRTESQAIAAGYRAAQGRTSAHSATWHRGMRMPTAAGAR